MKNGVRTSYLVCKRLTRVTERSINSCFSDLSDSTESMECVSIYHRVNRIFPKLIVKNLKDLKKNKLQKGIFKPAISCVYSQFSTSVPRKHRYQREDSNWSHFKFQWLIGFSSNETQVTEMIDPNIYFSDLSYSLICWIVNNFGGNSNVCIVFW